MKHSSIHTLDRFFQDSNLYRTVIALHCHSAVDDRSITQSDSALSQLRGIEHQFHLPSIVSITDQNRIQPVHELRASFRFDSFPLALEWVVPFGPGVIHLGIHNLPEKSAAQWERQLGSIARYRSEGVLEELLFELNKVRQCLIVLNHPFWDLGHQGKEKHKWLLCQFLHRFTPYIHALEYNGKRSAGENQKTKDVADQYGLPVVSGADVHGGAHPGVVNVTAADSFTEFVAEVRIDRVSNMLHTTGDRWGIAV